MVGIDIGSRTVKIVELEETGASFSLLSSGIVAVNGITSDKLSDEREVASLGQIIKKLHQQAGISSKDVVVSLPESQVFTRTINFPLLTDAEIGSAVKWEAEQYIPIPVAEAIIQHSVLERNEKSSPPQVTVLLVAAPKTVVEKYVGLVTAAGLNPVALETELMALTRVLAPAGKTVMLIDLGANSTDIAIAKSSLLSFSRSIPIAGEAFTRAVSQTLGITPQQAEEYKKTYGLIPTELEGKVKGALDPVLRMVVDEIKKAIHFYQTEEKGEAPAAIFISGGSSGMPEIILTLTNLLGIEVLIANPFSKLSIDPVTAKKLAPYAPLYAVSVGLAMREKE
jgi:type IV pilus assembly protein PilM